MGSKINNLLFNRHIEENIKFSLYMFMMKLVGEEIYKKYQSGEVASSSANAFPY